MLQHEFFEFFKGLSQNNSKAWFDEHRAQYERFVKKPFAMLVQDLIDRVREVDPFVLPMAKDAIFRINRDIRFAKDKTPYKTSTGAFLNRHGKKALGMPGLYFEVSHDRAGIAGGTYRPDPEHLERLRDLLMHEGTAFRAAIGKPSFIDAFGQVLGEKAKIIPKEFKTAAEREPLIYSKQLYWWKELDVEVFQQSTCIDVLFEHYMAQRDAQVLIEPALYDQE
jgi:uncharacterized protein (TIGR02453 family)